MRGAAGGHRCPPPRIGRAVESTAGGVEVLRGSSGRGIDAPREGIRRHPRVIHVGMGPQAAPRRRASMPSSEGLRPTPYP